MVGKGETDEELNEEIKDEACGEGILISRLVLNRKK
jgi:hypothetical protein